VDDLITGLGSAAELVFISMPYPLGEHFLITVSYVVFFIVLKN
jgi:hypothetical protein